MTYGPKTFVIVAVLSMFVSVIAIMSMDKNSERDAMCELVPHGERC